MHFRDEPIARMQALSLPMHWSLTWGVHFLHTSSIDNASGKHLGIWRERGGKSGATVPGRSSFCNKVGPGAPRVDMLKSATRLVFHSLPAAGRTPVLAAGTLRFSRCTLALLPLERSGACYCLWQFPTRLVPLEKHGGRQDEKYLCFKEKQGENPLLPLKHAGQVVPGASPIKSLLSVSQLAPGLSANNAG